MKNLHAVEIVTEHLAYIWNTNEFGWNLIERDFRYAKIWRIRKYILDAERYQ